MNSICSQKPEVAGLWIGETLPPLAELCIRSYLSHGIPFRLFTYRNYENIPEGTMVQNASEVIPEELVFQHDNGSLAPFADWFRNTWLERKGGFWTDLDVACLSPNLPEELPWFAEQEPGLIAVGVIGFPPHHPVMECLREVSEDPAAPMPWDTPGELVAKRQFKIDFPDPALRRKHAMWGNAGPEGFTRTLSYFQLLDMADSSLSIYPLHYTVWRNCYNGAVKLDSPALRNSWAIHLWGELLRREPDTLENVHKESIVGQLLDLHMPRPSVPTSSGNKKKVSILVGICTCANAEKKRETIRKTWMAQSVAGIECRFFLGRREALEREEDAIPLWVNDDDDHLPEKVLAFFRYALEYYDFDWLFKCDDNTYVALDRLAELADDQYDLIGDSSLKAKGAPSGRAGYFLSRSMVENIVAYSDIPSTGAENLIFGELVQRLGARTLASDRLNMNTTPYPMKDNDVVTARWSPPEHFQGTENFRDFFPVTVYEGRHAHWTDSLLFYRDGTFRREKTGCSGKYIAYGSKKLTLKWSDWPEEILVRDGENYSGLSLTLSRKPGQPDLAAVLYQGQESGNLNELFSGMLLIQMGCGANILPGWINLDLPQYDITRPLPWEDECVDAYFLEHVIEHVLPAEAYGFFMEAWRTLKPGGVLRLAFPDLLRIAKQSTPEYISFLQKKKWGDGSPGSAVRNIIVNHHHKAIWTIDTMVAVLKSLGYEVSICSLGKSSHSHLQGIESHASQLGQAFNELETSCVEAMKPFHS